METSIPQAPPVLSTPDTRILEAPIPSTNDPSRVHSAEEIQIIYEIERTLKEIRVGRWKTIALQFPDSMLPDAPRVYTALQDGLKNGHSAPTERDDVTAGLPVVQSSIRRGIGDNLTNERLFILADTSYGACCVDEIAAEHVGAEVVVHYGRACLSTTARLPVIHVFTTQSLDMVEVLDAFENAYPVREEKVVIMSDVTYSSHLPQLAKALRDQGYTNIFTPTIVHDPSSPLPNRTSPEEVIQDPSKLKDWHLFYISSPPEALVLTLSARLASMRIYQTDTKSTNSSRSLVANASLSLRRRYALVTRLSTASVFGILINTLSVKNYLSMVSYIQRQILAAGKKSYTFVVGKINAAKVANFSEVDGWVVVGCWESSLVENAEFWKPVVTPFELELALRGDKERVWTGEWKGDWSGKRQFKEKENRVETGAAELTIEKVEENSAQDDSKEDFDSSEESEPPEFDLQIGRYISHTRPMQKQATSIPNGHDINGHTSNRTSLASRAKGDLVVIGNDVSPAAEFLQKKRTWKGLGSDFVIAYDESGNEPGTAIEEGRSGIAKGYMDATTSIRS